MIIFEGRALLFDSVNKQGTFSFAKDCKIEIPKKVPLLWNFEFEDPEKVLGFASLRKDDKGLLCRCELKDSLDNIFKEDEYFVGGYYTGIKYCMENKLIMVTSCRVKALSILPEGMQADDNLIVRKVKEESSNV